MNSAPAAILVRVIRVEQGEWRSCQDVDIENQRPVFYVVEIVLDATLNFFCCVGFTAPSIDLGPTRYARFNFVACEIAVDHMLIE